MSNSDDLIENFADFEDDLRRGLLSPSNSWADGNDETIPPSWALSITATAAIIIAIVGFLGNLLTMLALPSSRRLRNASTWFVVNLAATECLFCLTVLPMAAAHLLVLESTGRALFSDEGCRAFVFMRYVNVQAELLSIAGVALNRCILIVMPQKYNKIFRARNTIIAIVSIWVISIAVMILPLIGVYGSFEYNPHTHECDFSDEDPNGEGPRRTYLALGFLTPAVIITVSYIFIFYKARSSVNKIQSMQQQQQLEAQQRSKSTSSYASESSQRHKSIAGLKSRDIRVAITILVIFIVFLVCCTPVSVMHYYDDNGEYTTALLLLHPLYWLQYCLNIFIYVFMNKQYRDAYVNYIAQWWPTFRDYTKDRFKWTEDEPTSDRASKPLTPSTLHRLAVTNTSRTKKTSPRPRESPALDESISIT